MEEFQIAKYGMMQVTALVYGVLASGAAVKMNKGYADEGFPMPSGYYHAMFFRDYGVWLMIFVVGWVAMVSYLSSPFTRWNFDADDLVSSGIVFAILLAVMGTFIAFGGATAPMYLIQSK